MFDFIKKKVDTYCDSSKDIEELITSRGFKFEAHDVQTDDGYILTLHRIVNPLIPEAIKTKPVLLQHGCGGSSVYWIIASDDGYAEKPDGKSSSQVSNNLGFALANQGFDVWMANSRGNPYSQGHKFLDVDKDNEYWDFGLDELIKFDLPATINYVLRETNSKSIGYIGLSQGTAIMFGLLSSQPQFNDVIKPYIALAPIYKYSENPHPFGPIMSKFASMLVGTGRAWSTDLLRTFSSGHILETPIHYLIHLGAFTMFGFSFSQIDKERLKVFYAHPVGDISWKTLRHHNQMYTGENFRAYDYGKEENVKIYGTIKPPEYDLTKITSKNICLFYGKNDWFVGEKDLQFVKNTLREPLELDYEVPHTTFNHTDFHYAKDLGILVNPKVIEALNDAMS